jgi:hypothetical protein
VNADGPLEIEYIGNAQHFFPFDIFETFLLDFPSPFLLIKLPQKREDLYRLTDGRPADGWACTHIRVCVGRTEALS